MAIYNINDQRVYVREEGRPGKQIALLVHGWSSSWYALSPLLPMLGEHFSCVAIDLPGYGNSPPGPGRTTIAGYADLLADIIRAVSDEPVVLVGHSMGGMISLTLALRHPDLVDRMVLLCPTISGHLSAFINFFVSPITMLERFPLGSKIVTALERQFVDITDRLMRPASFAERTDITARDYQRLRADARRPGQGRVRAECYRAMREGDLRGRLGRVKAPALVLWGAEDNTVPLRDAGVIADEWPAADVRIIPKAGHWPQFETPAPTRQHIAAFLGMPSTPRKQDDHPHPAEVNQVARFLEQSDLGNGLDQRQCTRLAALCHERAYEPGSTIASVQDTGDALYLVQAGVVEVWSESTSRFPQPSQPLATLVPGQITGEMALLDGGLRSADLRAGPDGALVLTLSREKLLALCDEDSALGARLLWNISASLAQRLRVANREQHSVLRNPLGGSLAA